MGNQQLRHPLILILLLQKNLQAQAPHRSRCNLQAHALHQGILGGILQVILLLQKNPHPQAQAPHRSTVMRLAMRRTMLLMSLAMRRTMLLLSHRS